MAMSASMISDRTLLSWLDDDPVRLEQHLTEHPEDTDRIDQLTDAPQLGQRLRDAMTMPEGFLARLSMLKAADQSKREAAEVLVDLFGTAWRTAAVLFADEE
jgi:hypothetical protein